MNTIRIETFLKYEGTVLDSDQHLSLKGTYYRFGIGAIPRGQGARKVKGGPLVPGPWAYAYGLCSVITSSVAMRAADAAERARDIEVESGTLLEIDGVHYKVEVERGQYINLVPLMASESPLLHGVARRALAS